MGEITGLFVKLVVEMTRGARDCGGNCEGVKNYSTFYMGCS